MRTKPIRLGVNVDHIATIREARGVNYPDPVEAALVAESAGCHGITVHLRQDRRHIKERDVRLLKAVVKTHLNVEISLAEDVVNFVREIRPHWVCLVPERPEEVTTEGGLDIVRFRDEVSSVVQTLQEVGIRVTVFVEPEEEVMEVAKELGVDAVEIHTGRYAEFPTMDELERIRLSARRAFSLGLEVHAGHGLNVWNVGPVAEIEDIVELNIGHWIVARASIVGMSEAVKEMLSAMGVK